jgi:DNA-binding CsgD family transcriptional regulator
VTPVSTDALELVRNSPVPALLVAVPSEFILAASDSAAALLSRGREGVEGRNFEDFALDQPSGCLGLMGTGRLLGYEASRMLRSHADIAINCRIWVRGFGDQTPPQHVIAVISAQSDTPLGRHPLSAGERPPLVAGTADESLLINRIGGDVKATLGWRPRELLGQSLLGLVSPEDLPVWLAAIAQAAGAAAGATMTLRARHAAGGSVACGALILPTSPAPTCAFTLTPQSIPAPAVGDERSDLTEKITRLRQGIDAAARPAALSAQPQRPDLPLPRLSPREVEIVGRLIGGDRVPAIAQSIFLSQSTVRSHLARAYAKLGVGSQQELIDLLRRGGSDIQAS